MSLNAATLSLSAKTCALLLTIGLLSAGSIGSDGSVRAVEVLRTSQTWAGSPFTFPQGPSEIVGVTVELAPGGETGWHSHPVPSFAFVMAGTLEVELANGTVKRIQSGEAFSEVIDLEHNGRNVGHEPAKLIVFYAASREQAITLRTHP